MPISQPYGIGYDGDVDIAQTRDGGFEKCKDWKFFDMEDY